MNRRTFAIARAVGAIGVTVALVSGITFAQLNSGPVTLGDTTINSATAGLSIFNGTAFASSAPGFTITGLIPGQGSVDNPFYFQNSGTVNLALTAHVTTAPTLTGFTDNTDLSKVLVTISNDGPTPSSVNTTLNELVNGAPVALPGNPLPAGAQGNNAVPGTAGNYSVKYDLDPTAVNGSSASVSGFTITFTGTQTP